MPQGGSPAQSLYTTTSIPPLRFSNKIKALQAQKSFFRPKRGKTHITCQREQLMQFGRRKKYWCDVKREPNLRNQEFKNLSFSLIQRVAVKCDPLASVAEKLSLLITSHQRHFSVPPKVDSGGQRTAEMEPIAQQTDHGNYAKVWVM